MVGSRESRWREAERASTGVSTWRRRVSKTEATNRDLEAAALLPQDGGGVTTRQEERTASDERKSVVMKCNM
jgi:hypothetical protein